MDIIRATKKGSYKSVKKILEEDPRKIDTVDRHGYTALMIASEDGNQRIVNLLLSRGANPRIKSKDSKTAFDVTDSDSIKKLLAQAIGAKPLIAMLSKNKRSKYIQLPKDIVRELHKYL